MRGMCRAVAIALGLLSSLGFPAKCRAVDFAPAKTYPVGTFGYYPPTVIGGDFNGDGKLDIAVANSGSGNVSILLGNGDGTFQAAVNSDAGAGPQEIAIGDFNGDHKLDLAVLLVGVLTWVVTGRALQPVEAMRREVEVIGAEDLHRRVPESSRQDEIGRLAHTMNAMLARLEDATDRQRRFVADASHELRSPLTGIRAQL